MVDYAKIRTSRTPSIIPQILEGLAFVIVVIGLIVGLAIWASIRANV